jgi:uncharacterized membrane protein (DUF4010 family)
MDVPELYIRFFVALAIGLAVGIERGWSQRETPSGEREAGIRTFTVFALTGFAAAAATPVLGQWFMAAIALGVLALIGIGYASEIKREKADRGVTTEAAAFLTFALGALAGIGEILAAGIVAVVLIAILDQKAELHAFLHRLQRLELTAAVKLLLVSVVLLPALPDQGFGPGGVLNPYELWWAVVVIATLGFAGYAAMKIVGPKRGALLMGLMGGFVSSTGVTVSASRASKDAREAAFPLASAIAVAQSVMFFRTGALVAVLNIALLAHVLLPLALGALTAIVGALILARRANARPESDALKAGSPDTLASAIQFVIVVALALLFAHYAQMLAGEIGVIVSGLVAGAVDVDAATVSASRLSGAQVKEATAAVGAASIAAALVANSLVKAGIAFSLGARELARPAAIVLASSGLAALIGAGLSYLLLGD